LSYFFFKKTKRFFKKIILDAYFWKSSSKELKDGAKGFKGAKVAQLFCGEKLQWPKIKANFD
jgi:hypothetical protein